MFSFLKRRPRVTVHNSTDLREFVRQTSEFLVKKIDGAVLEDAQVTNDGQAIIIIKAIKPEFVSEAPALEARIKTEVGKITGIASATVVMTSDFEIPKEARSPFAPPKQAEKTAQAKVPDVPVILAVSSGKGGVGKSTVAINLALAMAATGKKVGVLDSDIYGPSLPRLSGTVSGKAQTGEDGRLVPIEALGLKLMSMGYMVDEATPMIWRGPMAQSALLQMVKDVAWEGLDILVIDMPPGTGDIHLTLAQRIPLSGGVIVSTPQDIALIDARKGLEMFRKVSVPILGIVENMSYFCCPSCGHREDIFGHGGAKAEAEKLNVPFLGEIPLHSRIRELSDAGTPVVLADPSSDQAKAFTAVAATILAGLDGAGRKPPRIAIEP